MEVIEGQVQKLKLGIQVFGNGESVATSHVAALEIKRRPVRLEASVPIMVKDGDQLAVAGFQGPDGVLTGYAGPRPRPCAERRWWMVQVSRIGGHEGSLRLAPRHAASLGATPSAARRRPLSTRGTAPSTGSAGPAGMG